MKNKNHIALYKISLTAIFAALAFAGTCIHIPLPTGGMIHLGNFVVIIASLLCGGLIGGISGGLGCGLYDLLLYSSVEGFFKYLVLKFIMGMIVGYLFRYLLKKKDKMHVSLDLSVLGIALALITTLVIILYNNGIVKLSYQDATGYMILVSILAYAISVVLIIAAIFAKKLKSIHKMVLMSITFSIIINIFLEFIIKIILSMLIKGLEFKGALIDGFSAMPSCVLTGTVTLILGTLIYPYVYKATRSLNTFNNVDYIEE